MSREVNRNEIAKVKVNNDEGSNKKHKKQAQKTNKTRKSQISRKKTYYTGEVQ